MSSNGKDMMDNRDQLSNKPRKVAKEILEHGSLKGKISIHLSDRRTVIYTSKTDPAEIEQIRQYYEEVIKHTGSIGNSSDT